MSPHTTDYSYNPLLQFEDAFTFSAPTPENNAIPQMGMKTCKINTPYNMWASYIL
jgi:hypothetical protein